MKYRRLKLILIAACLLLFTGALVACRQKQITLDDISEGGYTCEVTFDLAGGTSGNDDRARGELHQYAKLGSYIIRPGSADFSGSEPVRDGYTFGGYYLGTKGKDGTIEYDLTHKWNFYEDKVTEDRLTLFAYWRENYKLVVHYGEDGAFDKTYETTVPQSEDGVAQSARAPAIPDHTVISFYATEDEARKKDESVALTFPVTPTDKLNEESRRWEIWADTIEGNFTVVRRREDFKLANGRNIYLLADIDFKDDGVRQEVTFPTTYSGQFIGNDHTVSGFKVVRTSSYTGDDNLGLIKKLAGSAVMRDVTFSDFELEITTRSTRYEYEIGALAGYAATGATVKNVKLQGTLSYTLADESAENVAAISPFIGSSEAGVVTEGCDYSGVVITKKTASA